MSLTFIYGVFICDSFMAYNGDMGMGLWTMGACHSISWVYMEFSLVLILVCI